MIFVLCCSLFVFLFLMPTSVVKPLLKIEKEKELREPVAWPWGLGRHLPPLFCQDGARDFFKINEKIVGGGGSS